MDDYDDNFDLINDNAFIIPKVTGIPLSATFNNIEVPPTEENLTLLITHFKKLYDKGVRIVTIPHTLWMLTGRFQKAYPDVMIKNTILRNTQRANEVIKQVEAGFHYINFDRDLMRLFGSDRIAKVMDRMGLKEGEVITHSMVTKSIERAQKKVEAMNFGGRKNIIEYDDVMNYQREIVYDRRNYSLHKEDISEELNQIVEEYIDDEISVHCSGNRGAWDFSSMNSEL